MIFLANYVQSDDFCFFSSRKRRTHTMCVLRFLPSPQVNPTIAAISPLPVIASDLSGKAQRAKREARQSHEKSEMLKQVQHDKQSEIATTPSRKASEPREDRKEVSPQSPFRQSDTSAMYIPPRICRNVGKRKIHPSPPLQKEGIKDNNPSALSFWRKKHYKYHTPICYSHGTKLFESDLSLVYQ
jgi:hypothetical protein